jgi:hypothetical protein
MSELTVGMQDRACDWAYSRLLTKARNGDRHQTRELATSFRMEVINECYVRAMVAIDQGRKHFIAHCIVRDVCKDLLR